MKARLILLLAGITLATSVCAQSLAITEVMYNPPESGTDSLEFIEIHNFGTTAIDVSGYLVGVTGSNVVDTLVGSIPAGGFYISAVNARAFTTIYGRAPQSQWSGSGLANGGDREIAITTTAGTKLSAFTYKNVAPWPVVSAASGPSIERCSVTADPNVGGNWRASTKLVGVTVNGQDLKASPFAFEAGTCGGVVVVVYPTRTIAALRPVNVEGVPTLVDSLARIEGIVLGTDLRDGGLQFTLVDPSNSAGIGVFSGGSDFGYTVREGDRLRLAGRITLFNGLTQIALDSLTRLSSVALPAPATVTTLAEATESRLVRIENLRLVDPAQFLADTTRSFNVSAITSTGDSVVIRIDQRYNILPPPAGFTTLSVTGIGGQFDNSRPFTGGYQISPRSSADISVVSGIEEIPAKEVFYARRSGSSVEITLLRDVEAVQVSDALGRQLAFAKTSRQGDVSLELGEAPAGLLHVTVVLPKGQTATQTLSW